MLIRNVAVSLQNVHKNYYKVHALKGISFNVHSKEVFGIVGPNGAGKTTVFRLIVGILKPDQGFLLVNGINTRFKIEQVRRMVGYLPEFPYIYERLSVTENLEFFAKVYGIKNRKERINQLLILLDIKKLKNATVAKLSKGFKQRVSIATALIHDPEIMVLDEPTAGLDPLTAVFIREVITQIAQNGKTILVSSHNLYEIEKICNQLAILNEGLLTEMGTPNDLKQRLGSNIIEIIFQEPLLDKLKISIKGVTIHEVKENSIIIEVNNLGVMNQLLGYLMQKGISIGGVMPRKSLEEVYVDYMKRRLE